MVDPPAEPIGSESVNGACNKLLSSRAGGGVGTVIGNTDTTPRIPADIESERVG